jgi:hypothetical protein
VAIFGKAGAELLPYLGDLAENGALVETVCGGYVDKLCDLQAQANDALNKVRA